MYRHGVVPAVAKMPTNIFSAAAATMRKIMPKSLGKITTTLHSEID